MDKFIFLLALTLFAGSSRLFSQHAAPDANTGLLFEIKGKGIAKPSYIFGTFHLICQADMLPLDKIDALIASADQTVMEIDMDDPAELRAMLGGSQMSEAKTLSDYLTPEKYKKVDETVQAYLGVSVDTMKGMKPSLIGVRVLTSPKAIGCAQPSSYDLNILQTSIRGGKPIIGLETVAFQSRALEAKPIAKQAEDLYKSALDPQKYVAEFKLMMDLYKQQDVDKLAKFTAKQMAAEKEFSAAILDDRNRSWIPKLEKAVDEKPSFIAVGAGHLGGKKGVLNLLRKDGYTVTPIHI